MSRDRPTLSRRLAATVGAAVCLTALGLLWQLRPPLPALPRSTAALLRLTILTDGIQALTWVTIATLITVLFIQCLRAGARPARSELATPYTERHARGSQTSVRLSPLDRPTRTESRGQPERALQLYLPAWRQPNLTLTRRHDHRYAGLANATPGTAPSGPEIVGSILEDAPSEHLPYQSRPRVLLLGPIEIGIGVNRRRRSPGPAHELIAYLALHPEGATRDELLERLWPRENPRTTEQRFWQATREARRLLHGAITRDSGRYQLDRQQLDIDADQLERLLADAERAADETAKHAFLEQAVLLFRGEPLQGTDYAWGDSERRRLHAVQAETLALVAKSRLKNRDSSGALNAAEQLIEHDPLNEQAWCLAMQAESALGHRQAILDRYQQLIEKLDERLGLRPAAETRDTYHRLLSQE
jgi:DNA-binding SARP family transcriptional activator